MSGRWDGELDGIKFRLMREADGGGYQRTFRRNTPENPRRFPDDRKMADRPDRLHLVQDSWQGGRLWASPTLGPETADAYLDASGISGAYAPGALTQIYHLLDVSVERPESSFALWSEGVPYEDLTQFIPMWMDADDLMRHDEGMSGQQLSVSTERVDFGPTGRDTMDLFALDDTIYRVDDEGEVSTWDGTTEQSAQWDVGVVLPGTAMVTGLGRTLPMVWTGDKLVGLVSTNTVETITDDGMGPGLIVDYIGYRKNYARAAVSTAEGIYYYKNVSGAYGVTCWVFRVERDGAGNIISTPEATLPVGYAGTSMGWHLGAPIIVAAPVNRSGEKLASERTVIFTITNGSLSVIGSSDQDDGIYSFLHADGDIAFFGGAGGLFVYDGVAGGIHPVSREITNVTNMAPAVIYASEDVFGYVVQCTEGLALVSGQPYGYAQQGGRPTQDDPWLESLWFDFGYPNERKTITKVYTWKEQYHGDSLTYSNDVDIYLRSDAATAWTKIADHDSELATERYEETVLGTPVTGRRFQYKIEWPTADAITTDGRAPSRNSVQQIGFEAEAGEFTEIFRLLIDGSELINVENEVQRPGDVYDNWVTLGTTRDVVTYTDSFRYYEHDDGTDHDVRIQAVNISKAYPGEAEVIEVVLAVV